MADFSPFFQLTSDNTPPEEIRDNIRRLLTNMQSSPTNLLEDRQIQGLLDSLPRLTEAQIVLLGHRDSLCPICFNPFLALLAEEESAIAMDSPAHPIEELGVTRLAQTWQCGHIFCRRDISKWIRDAHDSCPMCRRLLVEPQSSDTNPSSLTLAGITPVGREDNDAVIREMESQMPPILHGDLSFLANGGVNFPGLGQLLSHAISPQVERDDDERHEFSGMYS